MIFEVNNRTTRENYDLSSTRIYAKYREEISGSVFAAWTWRKRNMLGKPGENEFIYDNLVHQRKAVPAIVVMANGMIYEESGDKEN